MLTDAAYDRVRGSQFRLHYQYVMANDRRAPYDYYMLVCGPVAVTCWAKEPDAVVKRFGERAGYEDAENKAPVTTGAEAASSPP
jgi:hypothetical protein